MERAEECLETVMVRIRTSSSSGSVKEARPYTEIMRRTSELKSFPERRLSLDIKDNRKGGGLGFDIGSPCRNQAEVFRSRFLRWGFNALLSGQATRFYTCKVQVLHHQCISHLLLKRTYKSLRYWIYYVNTIGLSPAVLSSLEPSNAEN